MNISIHILCWNEELLLPFTINHYRERFPKAEITIWDNNSSDKSAAIASHMGCGVNHFDTGNQISDIMYQYIKNNCWKKSGNAWQLICDCDELLDIHDEQLFWEEQKATIIRSEGYNMINMNNNEDIHSIDHGYRDNAVCQFYDKPLLFNKNFIKEMNYIIGAHAARPEGKVVKSTKTYPLYHYKYISPDYIVKRHAMYAERLSPLNKKNNWGANYLESEESIRNHFESLRKIAWKVR